MSLFQQNKDITMKSLKIQLQKIAFRIAYKFFKNEFVKIEFSDDKPQNIYGVHSDSTEESFVLKNIFMSNSEFEHLCLNLSEKTSKFNTSNYSCEGLTLVTRVINVEKRKSIYVDDSFGYNCARRVGFKAN